MHICTHWYTSIQIVQLNLSLSGDCFFVIFMSGFFSVHFRVLTTTTPATSCFTLNGSPLPFCFYNNYFTLSSLWCNVWHNIRYHHFQVFELRYKCFFVTMFCVVFVYFPLFLMWTGKSTVREEISVALLLPSTLATKRVKNISFILTIPRINYYWVLNAYYKKHVMMGSTVFLLTVYRLYGFCCEFLQSQVKISTWHGNNGSFE